MGKDFPHARQRCPILTVVGLGALALLLVACGRLAGTGAPVSAPEMSATATAASASSTTQSATGGATLSCVTQMSPQGVDVITTILTCRVAGAPASDTSFTLAYTTASPNGLPHAFGAACAGALQHGAGACAERYSAPVPLGLGKGSVAGTTEPSERPLGPVTPTQQTPTSSGTQQPGVHPTFVPIG